MPSAPALPISRLEQLPQRHERRQHPLAAAPAADFGWSSRHHVIDLGGALGAVPAAVLGTHPHMTGAVFELPPVKPVFEAFVAATGLSERLTFHGRDFFTDALPQVDVYVVRPDPPRREPGTWNSASSS
ncbi:methyltransferase [Streptomyces sp. NPDC005576]|uniref:methyltransferase n=1 Tax=unclassified Streptomyces TaxID=2593676 RepID=UPI0033C7D4A9